MNAISTAVKLQIRIQMDERNVRLANIIRDATLRTRGLIDNILDFASDRLEGGIKLNFSNIISLEEALGRLVRKLRIAYPERLTNTDFDLSKSLESDNKHIAQLSANLLGNYQRVKRQSDMG